MKKLLLLLLTISTASFSCTCSGDLDDISEKETVLNSIVSINWTLDSDQSNINEMEEMPDLSTANHLVFTTQMDSILSLDFEGSITDLVTSGQTIINSDGSMKNLTVTKGEFLTKLFTSQMVFNMDYSSVAILLTFRGKIYECPNPDEECGQILGVGSARLVYRKSE